MKKIIVKNSKINGKGVFALCGFKNGDVVLHWDVSRVLSKGEIDKMSEEEKNYVSFLNGKYIQMQEPEKYVNHSCDPNTNVKDFCDVAVRDIKEGEEITSNYEDELPEGAYMECNCGSSGCRKIIKS